MGFKKKHTLGNGVNVDYWNIAEVRINKKRGYADAKLQGFINKKAYTDGLDEVLVKSVRIAWSEFEQLLSLENMNKKDSNIYSLIYAYAKTSDDFFKDAEDVLEEPATEPAPEEAVTEPVKKKEKDASLAPADTE